MLHVVFPDFSPAPFPITNSALHHVAVIKAMRIPVCFWPVTGLGTLA